MDLYSQIEEKRKKVNLMDKLALVWMVVFFILIFTSAMITDSNEAGFRIIWTCIFITAGGVLIAKKSSYNKDLQSMYKNNFLVKLLNEQFQNVQYNWEQGFTEQAVSSVGLVQMGNRFESEDFICGEYNGVFFEQSEVTVKRVVRSGKRTHTYTHFKGRMFTFNYGRKDIVSTMVFSRDFGYQGYGFNFNYEKVNMESQEFNRNFKIKSARPVDAFYMLTPQMMECIDKLERYFGNIAIHFTPGKVHVAFNTEINAYDVDTKRPFNFYQEAANHKRDMQVIIDIINALKIDESVQKI